MPAISPCNECPNRELSKSTPFIWITEPFRAGNRTPQLKCGENYPNPCWMCDRAIDYADAVADGSIGPPSSWPDGVMEISIDQVIAENMHIF